MTYSVVYTSATGNTAQLAQVLKEILPAADLAYFGKPDSEGAGADLIFAGFWTDKGNCGEELASFLKSLRGKRVFLFGTAGFGGAAAYFERILSGVKTNLDPSNTVAGTYMCQGKMPTAVRSRYETLQSTDPERARGMLENFDKALSHPDEGDLAALKQAVRAIL